MTKYQVLRRVYRVYRERFEDFSLFRKSLHKINTAYNNDIENAFLRASLRLDEYSRFKKGFPAVANLLCYIAVETLSNNLAYFSKTKGIKHTEFNVNYKIDKSINKIKEFINFIDTYCPPNLKSEIVFKKYINGKLTQSTFKDVLRYLYQKNRCWIVHKGIFRELGNLLDIFIDEQGHSCTVSIGFHCIDWLYKVVYMSLLEFLHRV